MVRMRQSVYSAALLGLALLATAGSSRLAAQQNPMAGNWELRDRAAIDSAKSAREEEARDTFQRDSGPPGEARRGGRGSRRGLSESDRFGIGLLIGMAQAVPAFQLAIDDSSVVVTNEDGFTYRVFPDGPKTQMDLNDDVTVEVKAHWDDGDLIIEYEPNSGGKLIESYFLADSGLYLRLEVTVEHGSMRRRFWESRMYRRVEGASPSGSP